MFKNVGHRKYDAKKRLPFYIKIKYDAKKQYTQRYTNHKTDLRLNPTTITSLRH